MGELNKKHFLTWKCFLVSNVNGVGREVMLQRGPPE